MLAYYPPLVVHELWALRVTAIRSQNRAPVANGWR
jgi:hypothetical protein